MQPPCKEEEGREGGMEGKGVATLILLKCTGENDLQHYCVNNLMISTRLTVVNPVLDDRTIS